MRGLESGAVRAPHRATLERLTSALSEVLGTAAPGCIELATAWRAQNDRPSLEALLSADQVASWGSVPLGAFRAQRAKVREVARWETMTIGADRGLDEIRLAFVVVVREPIDRWLNVDSVDPAIAPVDRPRATEPDNCRVGRSWSCGPDATMFEFCFDDELTPGRAYRFGYVLDHRPVKPPTGPRPAEHEALTFLTASGPFLAKEVRFHPDRLPTAVWHVKKEQ